MLFTDIEGSTRVLKTLGERYGELLADHRRLLREAFAARGGREMDTQGDAFFVAFDRARNAAIAAVEAQRALAAHEWPDGVECRVRMGLHTGEPSVGDEGYHGIGLHRGARIAAAAHGGQILVSTTTAELLQDDLPAGIRLRDLGEQQLKDIDRPEHVYQLVADGLTADFPPPRTAAAAPSRPRRRLVAFGIAAVVVAAAAAAAVIFATGGSSGPASASAAAVGADAVGIFRPGNGRLTGQVAVGSSPSAVTSGAGSTWVANLDDHSVSRIDPQKQVVIDTVQVGNGPAAIAYGAGFVWVTNSLDGTLSKIDPATNTVVDKFYVGNGPAGVAVAGRDVWVANSADGTVARIDPARRQVREVTSVGSGADGVAVGYGSIWVTNSSTATLTRLDARTGAVTDTIKVGSGASAVAAGAGSVWVANSLDGTVSRIDPGSDTVRGALAVGAGPSGVAVVPGAVWVSNELSGSLSRIDPARDEVVQTVTTGNRPEDVAGDPAAMFAAVRASGAGHRGGTLTVLTGAGYVKTDDPALAYGPEEIELASLTNDGLTGYLRTGGAAGIRLVPDLALSLPAPTDGGRTYRFRLHPGIRYSTGALVRPQDFRRAIERTLMLESPEAIYYARIVGAPRCLAAPRKPCDLSRGIVADPAANTVTFHLSSPDPDFLYALALNSADAVPVGTPARVDHPLPATGPYMFASLDPHAARLVRNPRFREWSAGAQPNGFPDRIVVRFGGSPGSRIDAVEHGSADVAADETAASPGVLSSVQTQHASRVKINPNGLTLYIALNTRIPPFDNLDARRAFNLAIDRQRLTELSAGKGLGQVTCQVLPPSSDGYRPYCPYTAAPHGGGSWTAPDLPEAQRLVRRSGTAGQQVTVWIPDYTHYGDAVGEYAVSVLDSLGYRASYRRADNPPGHAQAVFGAWYADYASAAGFFALTLTCRSYKQDSDGNTNSSGFCDPSIDREIAQAQALQTSDPRAAARVWAKVDRDVTNLAPWVSYGNGDTLDFLSDRVGNYQFNPQLKTLFGQLWVR
jgi:YVTN family beta-propeller protein